MPTTHTFESFFEDEKDRLLRVLSVITGSRAKAEDIAQEAFTRVFERWDSVETMEDPSGYLYRTAMNGFRSEYPRAARNGVWDLGVRAPAGMRGVGRLRPFGGRDLHGPSVGWT